MNHIMEVRSMFDKIGVDDSGCFVFELPDINIALSCIMFIFLENFTGFVPYGHINTEKTTFCGHFTLSDMSDVKYNKDHMTLFIEFGTESG